MTSTYLSASIRMQRGQTSNTTTTKPPIITLEERRTVKKRGPSEKHWTSPTSYPIISSHHIPRTPYPNTTTITTTTTTTKSKQMNMYLNHHQKRFASPRYASPPLPTPSKKKTQKINRYQPTNNLRCAPAPALAPSSHQSIQPLVHLFPILPWV